MFRNGNGSTTGGPGPGAGENLLRDSLISIQLDRYLTGLIWCMRHKSELAEIFGDV